MNRFRALLVETWWLWVLFMALGTMMSSLVSLVFLVTFPICVFTFFWFAYVRYDDDGNFKGS